MAIVSIIFVVFALVTLWKGVVTVPQGREYTVERFGKYRATFTPGLHWMVPYVDVGIGNGIMANGQFDTGVVAITTPDKTGYLCDDGVTYWR